MQAKVNWENHLLDLAGRTPHPHAHPFFSYWAGDASLQKAYKYAEAVTAEHSKSFLFASALLPEEKRSAVRALYAFAEPWMILWMNLQMANASPALTIGAGWWNMVLSPITTCPLSPGPTS